MNKLTKHLISLLFTIAACVAAGSAGAQSWSYGTNTCVSDNSCSCPQGWTYAMATGTNCGFDCVGSLCTAGCWNGGTNTCNSCGLGGTISLGLWTCFGGSGGQQNTAGFESLGSTEDNTCQQNDQCQGYQATCSSYEGSLCVAWNTPPPTGGAGSDIRLKRDIVLLGQTDKGIKLYSFKYLWSDQVYVGVMAQDLLENSKWQDAVITNPNGYYSVIYSKLGLEMVTLEQYQQVSAVALVK